MRKKSNVARILLWVDTSPPPTRISRREERRTLIRCRPWNCTNLRESPKVPDSHFSGSADILSRETIKEIVIGIKLNITDHLSQIQSNGYLIYLLCSQSWLLLGRYTYVRECTVEQEFVRRVGSLIPLWCKLNWLRVSLGLCWLRSKEWTQDGGKVSPRETITTTFLTCL